MFTLTSCTAGDQRRERDKKSDIILLFPIFKEVFVIGGSIGMELSETKELSFVRREIEILLFL